MTLAEGSPAWASPGAYRSLRQLAHSTGPPVRSASRPAIPVRNSVVAASSASEQLRAVASCKAPPRSPPPPSLPSSSASPKGMIRCSATGDAIVLR